MVREVRARSLVLLWFCLSVNSLKMQELDGKRKAPCFKKRNFDIERLIKSGLIINGDN